MHASIGKDMDKLRINTVLLFAYVNCSYADIDIYFTVCCNTEKHLWARECEKRHESMYKLPVYQ